MITYFPGDWDQCADLTKLISNPDILDSEDNEADDGILSPRIFGDQRASFVRILKCGCGRADLIHLGQVCPKCKTEITEVRAPDMMDMGWIDTESRYFYPEAWNSIRTILGKDRLLKIIIPVIDENTGMLKSEYPSGIGLQEFMADWKKLVLASVDSQTKREHFDKLEMMEHFGVLTFRYFPVVSLKFRPMMRLQNSSKKPVYRTTKTSTKGGLNRTYLGMLRLIKSYTTGSDNIKLECAAQIQELVSEFEISTFNHAAEKDHHVWSNIYGYRSDYCGYGVIVPKESFSHIRDSRTLEIPMRMFAILHEFQIVHFLNKHGYPLWQSLQMIYANPPTELQKLGVLDYIETLDTTVIWNRPPSFLLGSCLNLKIRYNRDPDVFTTKSCISLCNLMNADFDGDKLRALALFHAELKKMFENLKPESLYVTPYGINRDCQPTKDHNVGLVKLG